MSTNSPDYRTAWEALLNHLPRDGSQYISQGVIERIAENCGIKRHGNKPNLDDELAAAAAEAWSFLVYKVLGWELDHPDKTLTYRELSKVVADIERRCEADVRGMKS